MYTQFYLIILSVKYLEPRKEDKDQIVNDKKHSKTVKTGCKSCHFIPCFIDFFLLSKYIM